MIWSITPSKDATIYEGDPYRNTGLDQILELSAGQDPDTNENVESRILMNFDMSRINDILTSNGLVASDITATLVLRTVQTSELPTSYTINVIGIGDDWENGTGYTNTPLGKISSNLNVDGVSWIYTAGSGSLDWQTAASSSLSTMSYTTTPGGGDWNSALIATQSFSFKSDDSLSVDITNIVTDWINSPKNVHGIILMIDSPFASVTTRNTSIQLYSVETHTVYQPQLLIQWTGSFVYSTGSLTEAKYFDDPTLYSVISNKSYPKDSQITMYLGARPKYPRRTFSQNTDFSTAIAFPLDSFFQVRDLQSNEVVIPYSEFTRLITENGSSYASFYSTMLYPERYYQLEIKTTYSDVTAPVYYAPKEYIFKIIAQ